MSLATGTWYEPASLWSAAYPSTADVAVRQARFNREHLRNGGRRPITLTRVALCPINYPLEIANLPEFGQSIGGSAIQYMAELRLSLPFRKNMSRYSIKLSNYTPMPTSQPSGPLPAQSSLWGASYLRFDKPMLLPRMGSIEMGLMQLKHIRVDGEVIFDRGNIAAHAYYHEKGGLFSGSTRIKGLVIPTDGSPNLPIPDPYSCIPYPIPPNYSAVTYGGAVMYPLWPGSAAMTSREFEQQEATRSGSTEIYGMGVFIDQITYDDEAIDDIDEGAGASTYKISQLSTRTGIRVRAKHSPSGDWWWRPGAPLALVLDTITPALVYELPEPITLEPGDALDAALVLPGSTYTDGVSGPDGYQIGIAFNGYTAVEG